MSKTLLTPKEFIEGKGYKGLAAQTEICSWLEEYHNYRITQSKVLPEDVERAIESKYPSGEDGDFLEAALSYDCNKAAKWGYSLATDKSDAIKFGEWLSNNTEQYHLNEWMYNGRIHLTEQLYEIFKSAIK